MYDEKQEGYILKQITAFVIQQRKDDLARETTTTATATTLAETTGEQPKQSLGKRQDFAFAIRSLLHLHGCVDYIHSKYPQTVVMWIFSFFFYLYQQQITLPESGGKQSGLVV